METGFISSPAGELYFERSGGSNGAPLVCIHGGPGFTGYYLSPLHALSDTLPVIVYDQAGCGRARRMGGRKVFSIDGFVDELEALRRELALEQMHLFGHSFGGLIAGEYTLRYPDRVKSVIFGSVSIDIPRWVADSNRLMGKLDILTRMILREGERTGNLGSAEYQSAVAKYYKRHVYGFENKPDIIKRSEEGSDRQTYFTVWGANELVVNGLVKDYSLSPRLHEISCPTFFVCGRDDEATPEAHEYFASLCPKSSVRIFENSAHHPHISDAEDFERELRGFLRSVI